MIISKRIVILPVAGILCQMGLTMVFITQSPKLGSFQTPSSQSEAFRQAVNKAMNAAQLTQSAKSDEEWNSVAISWQEAVDLMKAVPASSSKYPVAQKKVSEYQRNLQYALSKISKKLPVSPIRSTLWSFGSTKEDVIRIQGTPTGVSRYDALCQEVLHYGNSTVELKNGVVKAYDNLDKNFKVSVNAPATREVQDATEFWTLGSKREEVFRIQGTPTRITQSDAFLQEVIHYESSTVTLKNGIVIGYNNLGNNLGVSVNPTAMVFPKNTDEFWGLGSKKEDVFRIQGTPTQVVQYDSLCKEVAYFGGSTVEFKNSIVDGYYNFDNNLKVK
ncbi:MAG: hypothetical protein LDL41_22745 [Coleofasciculus sp. S288]|nr:hypothetical protein [Coleofasciculus sp. S288]